MITLSTDRFSFNDGVFVAEASDLKDVFAQLEGSLTLQNPRSGNSVMFRFQEMQRDAEGDVILWRYVGETPNGSPLAVEILND